MRWFLGASVGVGGTHPLGSMPKHQASLKAGGIEVGLCKGLEALSLWLR